MKIPFLSRLRKEEVLGMDLGASSVKLIRFKEDGGLKSVGHWLYPAPILEDQEEEVPSFREFLEANQLTGLPVACNIEDSSLKIRRVDLPKMPDYDLKEAVCWHLRDVVEGPISDYVVRYSILEESLVGDVRKLFLVAYAIKKEIILRRLHFLKRLALDPVVIEPTSVSLLAAFDRVHGWETGEFYGLIDFGETKSIFTAMGDGKLFFSRPLLGVSGKDLQSLLEKELALSPNDSEELKRYLMEGKLSQSRFAGLKERVEILLPVFYTQISLETQRSLDAFFLMFHKERVHHLMICGGGATLPGLTDSLSKNLAVSTSLLDSSTKFQPLKGEPSHLFDVALGLALVRL